MFRLTIYDVLTDIFPAFLENDSLLVSDTDENASRHSSTTQTSHIAVSRNQFVVAQKADSELEKHFTSVNSAGGTGSKSVSYLLDKGVCMHKWSSPSELEIVQPDCPAKRI